MEGYVSREIFGFAISLLGSKRRPSPVKKLYVTVLQCILTPPFITVDIFSLVVSYLFYV